MPGVNIFSKKISYHAKKQLSFISEGKMTISSLAMEEKHLTYTTKAEEINIEGTLMTNIKGGVVILDMAGPASPAEAESADPAVVSSSRQTSSSGNTTSEAEDRAEQQVEDYLIEKSLPFFSLSN